MLVSEVSNPVLVLPVEVFRALFACSFLAIVGIPVLFFTLLTLVAMFPLRRGSSQTSTTRRIAIVLPAHDESLLITKTVEMAKAQKYPADCFPVFVIANACSDDTAAKPKTQGPGYSNVTKTPAKAQ